MRMSQDIIRYIYFKFLCNVFLILAVGKPHGLFEIPLIPMYYQICEYLFVSVCVTVFVHLLGQYFFKNYQTDCDVA